MKSLFFLLAVAPTVVLGTPAITLRGQDTSCDPYTSGGHTRGSKYYLCTNTAWQPGLDPDYNCVSLKWQDGCVNKLLCASDDDCTGSQICWYATCVSLVNANECRRDC
ncbi:hypothetical protein BGZ63DRAFT_408322 [Mariannaea sp. PMI_226]|nr:hypothetical protein BGZ63DRAFT_408322 [Mariannaea sp. PMI_226]